MSNHTNEFKMQCATLIRNIATFLIVSAALAGCGGSQSTANLPKSALPLLAVSESRGDLLPQSPYQVLYRFQKRSHGQHPASSLIDVNGTLYGTTLRGGSSGNGTVFSISSAGQEKVLHSFRGGADGAWPRGNLLDVNGTLYGTTSRGGSGCSGDGCGTVYSVTTSGSEHVLYSFTGGSDGADPRAGLINVDGTLYGTTVSGGPYDITITAEMTSQKYRSRRHNGD